MVAWTAILIRFALNTIIMGVLLYLIATSIEGGKISKIKVAFKVSTLASLFGIAMDLAIDFIPFVSPIILFIMQMIVWAFLIKRYFKEWMLILISLIIFIGAVYLILGILLELSLF